MINHLIIVEYNNDIILKSTYCTISAARKIPGKISALIINPNSAFSSKISEYVDDVYYNDNLINVTADSCANIICDCVEKKNISHIWSGTSSLMKETMPRVTSKLKDASMASDIQDVISENIFKRSMWAGDIVGTIKLVGTKKIITVRSTNFEPAKKQSTKAKISSFNTEMKSSLINFISYDIIKSDRPSLTEASIIISGGRGVKSDGFEKLIYPLADTLKAAVGATRAVCDAGWVPNDWQVGQTGKIVAPDLYIAIGISGAIQHVAGMKGSKTIVAINKDPDAPIFQVADYGIVGDAFNIIPELIKEIIKIKK